MEGFLLHRVGSKHNEVQWLELEAERASAASDTHLQE